MPLQELAGFSTDPIGGRGSVVVGGLVVVGGSVVVVSGAGSVGVDSVPVVPRF